MRQGAAEGRSSRRLVVAFLIAAVALLVVGPKIKPVASIFSPVFTPIESVVSGVADDVSGAVGSLHDLPTLESQIKALKQQNAVLIKQLVYKRDARRENVLLSRMLNFADLNPHLDEQPARVVDESIAGLGNSIGINVGSAEGIRMGNPVVDPYGFLVGRITTVWAQHSEVTLISAGGSYVPAEDSNTGAKGLVQTPYGGSPQLGAVQTGQKVAAGDLVETWGLRDLYPVGLVIGQITRVRISNVATEQTATMRTAADLNNLQLVQVIRGWASGVTSKYPKAISKGLKKR
jgi:rod shape-determining protein MreC